MYIDPFFFALANIAVDSLNLFGADLAEPVLEPDAFPFWDATMTILSIVAQVLMTRKYVENWILWIVINIISVGIYATQGRLRNVCSIRNLNVYCGKWYS